MNYDIKLPPPRDGSLRADVDHKKLAALVMQRDLLVVEVQSVLGLARSARETYEGASARATALANEHGRRLIASLPLNELAALPLADLDGGNIDPALVREALHERTRWSELQKRVTSLHAKFGPLDRLTKACEAFAAERI